MILVTNVSTSNFTLIRTLRCSSPNTAKDHDSESAGLPTRTGAAGVGWKVSRRIGSVYGGAPPTANKDT